MRDLLTEHWTLVSVGILFIAALWIGWSIVPSAATTAGNIPAPMEGFLAPDFELNTLDGEKLSLSSLRGKTVLINFWASWCPPCRSEMPAMQQVFAENDPEAFVILAVNNTQQDRLSAIESFIAERGLSFPVLLDTNGQVTNAFQVRSLPTSFFVDRDGIIREIVIGGPMSEALLRTRVENLLAEDH